MRVNMTVNGRPQQADDVWEGESLLYVLRERMGLPGSKNACEVVTVEGLPEYAERRTCGDAGGSALAPVQQAFIDAGAVQCGFCTPGLLVAADELLERHPDPSDADIREALSGNLCRCTGYEKILDAVRLAAARTSAAASGEAS